MRYSKIIVVLCIVLAIAFTVAVLVLMAGGMDEPMTLIPSFFAFVTGELWALATIKKKEVQNGLDTDYSGDSGLDQRDPDDDHSAAD